METVDQQVQGCFTVCECVHHCAFAGSYLDEHLSNYLTADGCGRLPQHKYKNKANSAMVVLRGKEAGQQQRQDMWAGVCVHKGAATPARQRGVLW